MPGAPQIFDRKFMRMRRDRIAKATGGANLPDFLLERVADDFAERLSLVRRDFPLPSVSVLITASWPNGSGHFRRSARSSMWNRLSRA